MVALGRIVLNKRERVMALEPFGKGLLGTTLHYAYEVRDAADYFDDIADVKISGEMLKLAQHIMEGKSGEFEPSEVQGSLRDRAGRDAPEEAGRLQAAEGQGKAAAAPNVVNLMDALRQSIASGRRTAAAEKGSSKADEKAPAPKKGKKQVAGQREMLLPIEGKKTKEVKKPAAKPAGKQRKAG